MDELKRRFPIYSTLLELYPAEYRKEYREQMLQTAADMLDSAPTPRAKLAAWSRIAMDLPISISKQQLLCVGGFAVKNSPPYIRRNSVISGLLVAPSFIMLAAFALQRTAVGPTFYNSWLWGAMLRLWAFYLPLAALLLAGGTYLVYVASGTRDTRISLLKRALDIRRSWPIILPGVAAFSIIFFVLFHDTAHCWVQNPMYFITQAHQTWQCTQSGFSNGVF